MYKLIILQKQGLFKQLFMLDHLFGSKTRVALLRLFFDNPDQPFFVRELTRELGAQINSVRRELENLAALGIVQVTDNIPVPAADAVVEIIPKGLNKKKYYLLNKSFVLHAELSGLFSKSHLLLEKELLNELRNIGQVQYLALTGFFTGLPNAKTDMLLVGTVNKEYVSTLLTRYRAGIRGMVQDDAGPYVRIEDVRALIVTLRLVRRFMAGGEQTPRVEMPAEHLGVN